MRVTRMIQAVDTHVCGEPGRVIVGGVLDVPGSTMVVAMARNGTEFGIRLSGTGDAWFTGPASDVQRQFPGMNVEIQRPPGSEKVGFLVTTDALEISESWAPQPKPVQAGAVFKRTIRQRADQLSSMALSPPDTTAPESIRVYTHDPVLQDNNERGDFLGVRSDTITYQMSRAGIFTLPELTYVWWNPESEKLETKTLPAVSFAVSPAASSSGTGSLTILLPLLLIPLGIWKSREIIKWSQHYWKKLRPADKILAKKLLRACRQNNDTVAANAWYGWLNTQPGSFEPDPELRGAVLALLRHIFAATSDGSWRGEKLAGAFTQQVKAKRHKTSDDKMSSLPRLNG